MANVAIFCATDGREDFREEKAFVMAEAVATLAGVKQLWGLTRIGPVEALDIEQIHAPYLDHDNNGLVYASELLYNNPMVAQVQFVEDEVVRSPLVREITHRQRTAKTRPHG